LLAGAGLDTRIWDRTEEAQWIFSKRRAVYQDQMQFNFD